LTGFGSLANLRDHRSLLPAAGAVFTLTLALAACGSGDDARDPAGPAVTWEVKTVEQSAGDCDPDGNGACANFRFEYPEFTGGPADVVAALQASIDLLLLSPSFAEQNPSSVDELAERFLARWRESHEAFPEAATNAGWFLDSRISVIYHDAGVLSIELAEKAYTGGAHANTANRYASFDLSDGTRINLARLLVPGYESRLNAVAERRFREIRQIPAGQSLTDAGYWFDEGTFALNDNFAVTGDGLLFYFNPYEVTAYAEGPTKLVLTPQDLGGLILPGGALDR
jgi:hypothetical protein